MFSVNILIVQERFLVVMIMVSYDFGKISNGLGKEWRVCNNYH